MITIEKLKFAYGKESLFNDVSLSLQAGSIYGLLGLNGAGKSTLLQIVAGLLFPNKGKLDVLGYQPERRQPSFLSKLFVLPETVVVPNITDREYINARAPFYRNFDHDLLERCLSEFEVPRARKLATLSHGQQKKFLLSFGLACRSEVLILDEPTNGLDIPSKGLFKRLVAESFCEDQIFIVSTHQVHDIESLIDSIVVLYDGDVLFNHPVSSVAENLRMSLSATRPEVEPALLYCEQTIGGFASLWHDTSAPDGQVDMELLFKAIIENPSVYPNIFKQERV